MTDSARALGEAPARTVDTTGFGDGGERPRIAHIRDWRAYEESGEVKALCGRKLKGVPPPRNHEACVVCVSLAHNSRWAAH